MWAQVSCLCFVCDVTVCSVRYSVLVSGLSGVKLLMKLLSDGHASGFKTFRFQKYHPLFHNYSLFLIENRNLHCFIVDGLEFYSPMLSFDIDHSWKYLCKRFKKTHESNFQECVSYRSNLHNNIFTLNILGTF